MSMRTNDVPKVNRFARKQDLIFEIGARIRAKRIAAGMTIRALAIACEVTTNTIVNAESGQSISVYLLVTAAEVFDTTLDDLVPIL